uniref:DUF1990 domain-containing protein n=1 Tax=Oryza punctata TaxID=4537 RepID=A0A0E0K7M1_ORYPU
MGHGLEMEWRPKCAFLPQAQKGQAAPDLIEKFKGGRPGCTASPPPTAAATAPVSHRTGRRPSLSQCQQPSPPSPSLTTHLTLQYPSRPSQDQQKSCLSAAGGFNYDAPLHGASRTKSVAKLTAQDTEASDKALIERGFFVNRSRVLVGSGTTTFNHAKSPILSWKHLALGWANVEQDTPVKAGTRFCICYKELIPWVMLPLQIAYVTDGNGGNSSGNGKGGVFAFGSGTLQAHLLAGEERFSVQLDEDDQVWYEVMSFSKPAHILSSLGYPYVQLRQRHFALQSGQALLRHVASRSKGTR